MVHQGCPSFVSFSLFFAGTILFTMSCTLLASGVWCLLVRLPVIHLVHGPTRILVTLTGYMVTAGVITFPAACILYRQHNVTRRRRPLLPVIALLSICTIFLTCCTGHAIVYRKSAYSDHEDSVASSDKGLLISRPERAALLFGKLRDRINAALTARLRDYPNYSAWDLMQSRLQCCGMNSTKDESPDPTVSSSPWICRVSRLVHPRSSHECNGNRCPDEDDNGDGKKRNASRLGCLDAITLDLMWITAYIVGLCSIAIFADVLVILSIGILLRKPDWKAQ